MPDRDPERADPDLSTAFVPDTAPRGLLGPAWIETARGVQAMAVVVSGEFAGMTPAQVSKLLCINVQTVYSRLRGGFDPRQTAWDRRRVRPRKPPHSKKYAMAITARFEWIEKYLPPEQRALSFPALAKAYGISVPTLYRRISDDRPPDVGKYRHAASATRLAWEKKHLPAHQQNLSTAALAAICGVCVATLRRRISADEPPARKRRRRNANNAATNKIRSLLRNMARSAFVINWPRSADCGHLIADSEVYQLRRRWGLLPDLPPEKQELET